MRLIDADKEIERLKKGYCEECTRKGNYGIFEAACTPCWVMDAVDEFENAETFSAECHGRFIDAELAHKMLMEGYDLRDVPSADVEPVRRGHWKYASKNLMASSVCGNFIMTERISDTIICPCCGAKLVEETE